VVRLTQDPLLLGLKTLGEGMNNRVKPQTKWAAQSRAN
jgi:hypothetical protein